MEIPLQIVFRNVPKSDALAALIERRAAKLGQFYDRITSCRVVVETHHQSHRQGNIYGVKIFMVVPGEELGVEREQGDKHAHEDPYVTVRDAFDAATRLLEDYVGRLPRRSRVERVRPPHGRVLRLVYEDGGYGFLEDCDGREIYFHAHSVLDGKFERLTPGTEVRFAEEEGDEGPQASTVEIVGKDGGHVF